MVRLLQVHNLLVMIARLGILFLLIRGLEHLSTMVYDLVVHVKWLIHNKLSILVNVAA